MKLKRNLILLIAIIGISFKSFSQTDTRVLLTETTARLVVKDLVTYDGLKVEYDLMSNQIKALEQKVLTLQEVISNLELQLQNRGYVIEQKDDQIKSYQEMTDELKSALSRERRKKGLYKLGSLVGALFLASSLL